MAKTKDIERAQKAFECVTKVKSEGNENLEKKYASYVKSAPSMILSNGLGQSLAFWKSKASGKNDDAKAYRYLLKNLDDNIKINNNQTSLFEAVIGNFTHYQYKVAAAETLAFLGWLKRFATSELKQD
jgi:CRISPR-associated protein Cmr5